MPKNIKRFHNIWKSWNTQWELRCRTHIC